MKNPIEKKELKKLPFTLQRSQFHTLETAAKKTNSVAIGKYQSTCSSQNFYRFISKLG